VLFAEQTEIGFGQARSNSPDITHILQKYSKKYMSFKKKSIFYLCRNRLLCKK